LGGESQDPLLNTMFQPIAGVLRSSRCRFP
jgi:hypothetical protein